MTKAAEVLKSRLEAAGGSASFFLSLLFSEDVKSIAENMGGISEEVVEDALALFREHKESYDEFDDPAVMAIRFADGSWLGGSWCDLTESGWDDVIASDSLDELREQLEGDDEF